MPGSKRYHISGFTVTAGHGSTRIIHAGGHLYRQSECDRRGGRTAGYGNHVRAAHRRQGGHLAAGNSQEGNQCHTIQIGAGNIPIYE